MAGPVMEEWAARNTLKEQKLVFERTVAVKKVIHCSVFVNFYELMCVKDGAVRDLVAMTCHRQCRIRGFP